MEQKHIKSFPYLLQNFIRQVEIKKYAMEDKLSKQTKKFQKSEKGKEWMWQIILFEAAILNLENAKKKFFKAKDMNKNSDTPIDLLD